jgi:hypothetical protein
VALPVYSGRGMDAAERMRFVDRLRNAKFCLFDKLRVRE